MHLVAPIADDNPVGSECLSETQAQNLGLMSEFLVKRAIQKGVDRAAQDPALDEDAAALLAGNRDDHSRALTSLEGVLKEVLRVSSVNSDQLSSRLRERTELLLAERGKDLRVLPHLCAAMIQSDGLRGYADCLQLADALLDAYGGDLYPLPDEDDPSDTWERAAAISDLVSSNDVRALLSDVVLVDARQWGAQSLANVVGGMHEDMPVAEVAQHNLAAAVEEVGSESVQAVLTTLAEIQERANSLVDKFDPTALAAPYVVERLRIASERLAGSVSVSGEDTPTSSGDAPDTSSATAVRAGGARGEIQSREDARRLLQEVIRYLERVEPSHPAPLFLRRADRLLGMSFIDIIRDLTPDAVTNIEHFAGVSQEPEAGSYDS